MLRSVCADLKSRRRALVAAALSALFVLTEPALAQTGSNWEFGMLAQLAQERLLPGARRISPAIGVDGRYFFNPWVGIEVELLRMDRGDGVDPSLPLRVQLALRTARSARLAGEWTLGLVQDIGDEDPSRARATPTTGLSLNVRLTDDWLFHVGALLDVRSAQTSGSTDASRSGLQLGLRRSTKPRWRTL